MSRPGPALTAAERQFARSEARRLREEGVTLREIGKMFGVSHVAVVHWLKYSPPTPHEQLRCLLWVCAWARWFQTTAHPWRETGLLTRQDEPAAWVHEYAEEVGR